MLIRVKNTKIKKRSSFSEAEGPNGPNVPRLLYKQIHKHFDPLFHDPRNVPPEEDEEGSESSGKNEQVAVRFFLFVKSFQNSNI